MINCNNMRNNLINKINLKFFLKKKKKYDIFLEKILISL